MTSLPDSVRRVRSPRWVLLLLIGLLSLGVSVSGQLPAQADPSGSQTASPAAIEEEPSDSDGDGRLDSSDVSSAAADAHEANEAVEDLSQRGESTRVMVNPDGSITEEAYGAPMWVQDSEGRWVDVDYTLVPRAGGGFAPKAAPTDLVIDGGTKEFARLTLPDGTVSIWSWPKVLPTPTLEGPVATYAVSDGVDLIVIATARGVATRVRVASPDAVVPAFRVQVRTVGAGMVETDEGRLVVTDGAHGDPSARTAVLSAWDSRRDAFGDPVKVVPVDASIMTIATKGERVDQELTLEVPSELISDPGVEYPIFIDPDLSPFGPEQDSWAREGMGWVSALDYRLIVRASKDHVNSNTAVSLLQWDDGRIRNRNISDAEVGFFQYMSASCSAKRVNVHQVLGGWDENTLNWANRPAVSGIAAAYFTKNIGYTGCTPAGGFVTANVTGLVQAWADGALNVGLQLSVPEANKTDFSFERRLCSVDFDPTHTTCNKASRTPYLKFTYTNRAPYTPAAPSVSGDAWVANGQWWTPDLTPTFNTRPIGVWGSTLQVTHQVWVPGTSILAGACASAWVASWGDAACAIPGLAPGRYVARSVVQDNFGAWSGWSAWTDFGIHGAPSSPELITLSPLKSDGVTWSLKPRISAKVTLPSGKCYNLPQSCLSAEFTLKDESGSVLATLVSTAVTHGGTASVELPQLQDSKVYRVAVRTISTDAGTWYSPAIEVSFLVDAKPGLATNVRLANDGTYATGSPLVVTAPSPVLSAVLPGGSVCPGESPTCLMANFEVWPAAGSSAVYSAATSGAPADSVAVEIPAGTLLRTGQYTVKVRVVHAVTGVASGDVAVGFETRIPPAQPALGKLRISDGGTKLTVAVNNPDPLVTYTWVTEFAPESGAAPFATEPMPDLVPDAQGDLSMSWDPSEAGEIKATITAVDMGLGSAPTTTDSEYLQLF